MKRKIRILYVLFIFLIFKTSKADSEEISMKNSFGWNISYIQERIENNDSLPLNSLTALDFQFRFNSFFSIRAWWTPRAGTTNLDIVETVVTGQLQLWQRYLSIGLGFGKKGKLDSLQYNHEHRQPDIYNYRKYRPGFVGTSHVHLRYPLSKRTRIFSDLVGYRIPFGAGINADENCKHIPDSAYSGGYVKPRCYKNSATLEENLITPYFVYPTVGIGWEW
jgi:hypothetical protein